MASNGSKCAAYNCEKYQAFCPNLAFHRFPKVNENKKESYERCKKWLINCRRADLDDMFKKDPNYLNRNCRVCSTHFEDYCYKDLAIKVLKNDSVPTKFDIPNRPPSSNVPQRKPPKRRLMSVSPQEQNETITGPSPEKISLHESTIELGKVQRNERILKQLKNDSVPTEFDVPNQPSSSVPQRKPLKQRLMSPSPSNPQEENETTAGPSPEKVFHQESTRELAKVQKNERILKQLRLKARQQSQKIFRLKNQLASMRGNCNCSNYGSKESISGEPNINAHAKGFLKNQVLLAKYKPQGRRYTEESKHLALALYYCSPKAYQFCREVFSLPSVRSLQKWLSQPEVKEGFKIVEDFMLSLRKEKEDKRACKKVKK